MNQNYKKRLRSTNGQKVANSPKAKRKFLFHQTPFLNVEFVIPRNHYIHSNKEG
jgi:hypothetical protein